MKENSFSDDFLETFRALGPARLAKTIKPELDATLHFLAPQAERGMVVNELQLPGWTRNAIRSFDIVASCAALILLSPAILMLAVAIKLGSPGPVFYLQKRTGLNLRIGERRVAANIRALVERRFSSRRMLPAPGKLFRIYKLRSMAADAEKHGIQMAKKGDLRVTRIGRLMRRTRLDETPQFINVLKGDMSIVGPRPERPEIVTYLESELPGYLARLGMRPGITGLAQIRNGYDTDLEHIRRKIALDRYYIQHCSLANNVRIILRTFRVVLFGEGAM